MHNVVRVWEVANSLHVAYMPMYVYIWDTRYCPHLRGALISEVL